MNNLVSDLSDAVEGRIRYAFDLSRIAKEVLPKGIFDVTARVLPPLNLYVRAHLSTAKQFL